jgi:hypothetical protein
MKQNFTGSRSGPMSDEAVLRALAGCPDVIAALAVMADVEAIRRRVTKTALVGSLVSTRTWYGHMRREWPITAGIFQIYATSLTRSASELQILQGLYTAYVSKRAQVHNAVGRHNIGDLFDGLCKTYETNAADLSDDASFRIFARRALDSRFTFIPTDEIRQRVEVMTLALKAGLIKCRNVREQEQRLARIAFALHINAYTREDSSLQKQSINLLDSLSSLYGTPDFEYARSVVRLYGLNSQDRTLASSDNMNAHIRDFVLEQFIRTREIADAVKKTPEEDRILDLGSSAEYNIVSLMGEMDGESRSSHKSKIVDLSKADDDNGMPFQSTIYNLLSTIEMHIRDHEIDEALAACDLCLGDLQNAQPMSLIVEAQVRLKRVSILLIKMRECQGHQKSQCGMEIIHECDAAIPVAQRNGNTRMEMEFRSLRDLVGTQIGFGG